MGSHRHKLSSHDKEEARAAAITKQFAMFKERIMKLVMSNEFVDGIEIVAMRATVDMLIASHEQCVHEKETSRDKRVAFSSRSGSAFTLDVIGTLLDSAKNVLQSRVNEFLVSQVAWIKHCNEDIKRTTVLTPFLKFPAFIDQLKEFSGDKVLFTIFLWYFQLI